MNRCDTVLAQTGRSADRADSSFRKSGNVRKMYCPPSGWCQIRDEWEILNEPAPARTL